MRQKLVTAVGLVAYVLAAVINQVRRDLKAQR